MAFIVNEQLYGIGLTEYHYYLLTFDSLTIMSTLTLKVVYFFDLHIKTMGTVKGMIYDRSAECFWIYC
jgi:hypothetical protein